MQKQKLVDWLKREIRDFTNLGERDQTLFFQKRCDCQILLLRRLLSHVQQGYFDDIKSAHLVP